MDWWKKKELGTRVPNSHLYNMFKLIHIFPEHLWLICKQYQWYTNSHTRSPDLSTNASSYPQKKTTYPQFEGRPNYLSFCPSSLSMSSELIKSRKRDNPSSVVSISGSSTLGSNVGSPSSSSSGVPPCSKTCGST